ncbi:MAG: response regulator transcription factor [Desulfuromonadaceae bacterium]|nr:response regulator transcription factor [Desulfuromonadaceae bacterium]
MYTILILEDNPVICSNMEIILKMEGFSVSSAADGQSGLDMIRKERPDLILCDILMPLMDGHDVLETLKNEGTLADIPFIFVTALEERADVRRGMSAGADDYLTKPFSAEELVSAVIGRLHRLELLRMSGIKTTFEKERAFLNEHITAREREVLLLVGNGATSREIAERLGISARTAEVHRANLMHKLDAANSAMLARWAVIAELL